MVRTQNTKTAARFERTGPILVTTDQKSRFKELPGVTARVLS